MRFLEWGVGERMSGELGSLYGAGNREIDPVGVSRH